MTQDSGSPTPIIVARSIQRDGTSQAARPLPALDPAYAALDDRSVGDLLRFARAYAHELRFFDEQNQPDGDWSALFGIEIAELERYLATPELSAPGVAEHITARPHLALLLTFLDLLQHARRQLNDLTRRHLEFSYREALGLTSRAPQADNVHVLLELAPGEQEFSVPAGTLVRAGQDGQGNDLLYSSDNDLVVNRARVASLKSLFVQRRLIGIAEARHDPYRVARLFPQSSKQWIDLKSDERAFMAMLAMALGEPAPGAALPNYPGRDGPPGSGLLEDLDTLTRHIGTELHMPLPAFRSLMELQQRRSDADDEWAQINAMLQQAGTNRDRSFQLDTSEPRNFERNLLQALGRADFAEFFNTLAAVDTIYDLHRLREREDVRSFIEQNKLFMSFDAFDALMTIVDTSYKDWRRIYDILRAAGRKKRPGQPLDPPKLRDYAPDKFALLLQQTLGEIHEPATQPQFSGLVSWYQAIRDLERYFHMPVEEFVAIRAIAAQGERSQPWERQRMYEAFERAHCERATVKRWEALESARRAAAGIDAGVEAMFRLALGHPRPVIRCPMSARLRSWMPRTMRNTLASSCPCCPPISS
ncbi:MAG: hypothetical protein HC822_12730 [Oscillochloris sp.]|nr:hypothetical protein [Oscillochloris sp.]